MLTVDERINNLEKKYNIAGTIISRSLINGNLKWTLKFGEFWDDKRIEYNGYTIEECLKKAEDEL